MDPFWSVAFCLSVVGSEGGTGDSSPETALQAALAQLGKPLVQCLALFNVFGIFRDKQDSLFIVVLSRSPGSAVSPEKNG